VHTADEVGVELRLDRRHGHVLDRPDAGKPCVVDHDIEPAKPLDTRLHGLLGRIEVGDVERQRQDPVAVAGDELIELAGLTRCCNQLMSSIENRGCDAAAQAARATRQKESLTHHALHGFD
jgi:hypothetical protein